jgi:hypothetical protein
VIKHRCTTGKERRIRRWEHEDILERVQKRLDDDPDKIPLRSKTVEHPFGTIKAWMGGNALQDEDAQTRGNRDGVTRAGLQYDEGHRDPRRVGPNQDDGGVRRRLIIAPEAAYTSTIGWPGRLLSRKLFCCHRNLVGRSRPCGASPKLGVFTQALCLAEISPVSVPSAARAASLIRSGSRT